MEAKVVWELAVGYSPVFLWKGNPHNGRTYRKAPNEQDVASISTSGFDKSILIDGQTLIVDGNGRAEAASSLGLLSGHKGAERGGLYP